MMKKVFLMVVVVAMSALTASGALSIYDIQYTTNTDGSSDLDGQVVDCQGGIVIHKTYGSVQRIMLYDPNYPDAWGGIQSKDLNQQGVFADVNIGDWVSLTNVKVEEYRGTTFLQYTITNNSSHQIVSTENILPEPLVVDVNEVSVIYDESDDSCYVTDHRAEKYESMYIQVRDVIVGDMDVGKAKDNYSLNMRTDPNIYCWASDYMNIDKPPDPNYYLPIVQPGQHFCAVNGILEQYTKLISDWDYYQILTTNADDFVIEQPGDLDGDCDVDFVDLAILSDNWLVGTK